MPTAGQESRMTGVDPKSFWEEKILAWEDNRYVSQTGSGFVERIAGSVSTSLRFRMHFATNLLAPYLRGRRVVELGCGSGLLAVRLMELGASGYVGYDISDKAISRAKERFAGSPYVDAVSFQAASVDNLGPQGSDTLIISLGLFDWLTPAQIEHVFSIGREGHYLHAVAEKRLSIQQFIHRLYIHFAYGHRTGGYVPQYHSMAEITNLLARSQLPTPNVIRRKEMRFGVFITNLAPLGSGP